MRSLAVWLAPRTHVVLQSHTRTHAHTHTHTQILISSLLQVPFIFMFAMLLIKQTFVTSSVYDLGHTKYFCLLHGPTVMLLMGYYLRNKFCLNQRSLCTVALQNQLPFCELYFVCAA